MTALSARNRFFRQVMTISSYQHKKVLTLHPPFGHDWRHESCVSLSSWLFKRFLFFLVHRTMLFAPLLRKCTVVIIITLKYHPSVPLSHRLHVYPEILLLRLKTNQNSAIQYNNLFN